MSESSIFWNHLNSWSHIIDILFTYYSHIIHILVISLFTGFSLDFLSTSPDMCPGRGCPCRRWTPTTSSRGLPWSALKRCGERWRKPEKFEVNHGESVNHRVNPRTFDPFLWRSNSGVLFASSAAQELDVFWRSLRYAHSLKMDWNRSKWSTPSTHPNTSQHCTVQEDCKKWIPKSTTPCGSSGLPYGKSHVVYHTVNPM